MPSLIETIAARPQASDVADRRARVVLSVTIVAFFWQLSSMTHLLVTPDIGAMDMLGGELPHRAWVGAELAKGRLPLWCDDVGSGTPSTYFNIVGMGLFAALPPVVAMNAQLLAIVLTAAHGAYGLARRLGANAVGATSGALAYALSGFMVCQLKHVAAVQIASLTPVGLSLIHDAMTAQAPRGRRRSLRLAGFALVVGVQALSGFPQTLYYATLAYAAFVLAHLGPRTWGSVRRARRTAPLAIGALVATALGIGVGWVSIATMHNVARYTERGSGVSFEWATRYGYDVRNLWMFVHPYFHGSAADHSYHLRGIFWEDDGYVGLVTLLLVAAGPITLRHARHARFLAGMTVVSLVVVLGRATPLYRPLFDHVPGLNLFRFSTRAMFLVDLGLGQLAALSLTRLMDALGRRVQPGIAARVGLAAVALAGADLAAIQYEQNAFGDPATWLAPPQMAREILRQPPGSRLFTVGHLPLLAAAFRAAHGWFDLREHLAAREVLAPDINLLWGVPTVDGYGALYNARLSRQFGDPDHVGLIARLPEGSAPWRRLLELSSVRWLVAPRDVSGVGAPIARVGRLRLYEVSTALPRARFVPNARLVSTDDDALRLMLSDSFDPASEVVVQGACEPTTVGAPAVAGSARILSASGTSVRVEANAPNPGWVVLGDTFFEGWQASVDGRPTTVVRANTLHRAVRVGAGHHTVVFRLKWRAFRQGAFVSMTSVAVLAAWILVAASRTRRRRCVA